MKKCLNCGQEAEEDQVFCLHCGSRLGESPKSDSEFVDKLNQQMRKKDEKIDDLKIQIEQIEQIGRGCRSTKRKWIIFCIILLAGCVISLVIAYYQWERADRYMRRVDDHWTEFAAMEEQYTALKEQADFLDDKIAIVDASTDDIYYHTYGCSTWDWDLDWEIFIYDRNYAEALEFIPCPECK